MSTIDPSQLAQLRHEFEELLYYEAWLLDTDRLEDWLDLFAEHVRYWAPVRENLGRGKEDFSLPHLLTHFDDDKNNLILRVQRVRTGVAHAEEPPSRVRHFVSNVRVLEAEGSERVKVGSNIMVFRNRWDGAEHLFVGCREDWWRRIDGKWKNEERFILLDHGVLENVTVFF